VQVGLFQLIRATKQQRLDGSSGEQRAEAKRDVCGIAYLLDRGCHQLRHTLAAEFRRAADADPSVLGERLIGLLEALRRADIAVCPLRPFPVTYGIDRTQYLARELARFLEDGVDQGGGGRLLPRQTGHLLESRQLVHDEAHVVNRCYIIAHDWL